MRIAGSNRRRSARIYARIIADLMARYRAMFSRMSLAMGSAVVSRAAQLVVVMLLARRLDATDFGWFTFAIGASVISGMIGNLGWQFSFNRFYAVARRKESMGELRGLLLVAERSNLLGGLVVAFVLLISSLFIHRLAYGLCAAAVLTIPQASVLLRRQQLAGTGQAPFALILDQGFASMGLCLVLLAVHLSLTEVFVVYFALMVIGNFLAALLVRRKLPTGTGEADPIYFTREWLRVGCSLLQSRAARLVLSRLDVLLLPTLATLAAAGIYGAAFRATYILTFPQFVLQTINAPQFAEAFAAGRVDRARGILWLSLGFAVVTSIPPLAVFLLAPQWSMTTLFGPKFEQGAVPLVLVAIGQFAMGLCIPYSTVLTMAGREREIGRLSLLVLAASLAASLWLIPRYGATGAGSVTLGSGVILLLGQAYFGTLSLRDAEESAEAAAQSS